MNSRIDAFFRLEKEYKKTVVVKIYDVTSGFDKYRSRIFVIQANTNAVSVWMLPSLSLSPSFTRRAKEIVILKLLLVMRYGHLCDTIGLNVLAMCTDKYEKNVIYRFCCCFLSSRTM